MNLFRELNEKEVQEYKLWARENYILGTKVNEVYHPVVQQECDLMNREEAYKVSEKYARQCSITGEGMNEGFCICDGDMHIKYEKDMIQHITDETGYDTIEEAYKDEYYYWTEWECETDLQYEEINGVLTEIN